MSIRSAWWLAAVVLILGPTACLDTTLKGSGQDGGEQPGQDIAADSGAGVDVGVDPGADLFVPPPDVPPDQPGPPDVPLVDAGQPDVPVVDAGQPDVPPLCVPEGEGFEDFDTTGKCCDGLVPVQACEADPEGGCACPNCPCFVCTACGDGVCGPGENLCNCQADCDTPNACKDGGGECLEPLQDNDGYVCPPGTSLADLDGCPDGQICCVEDVTPCLEEGKTTGVFPEMPQCCPGLTMLSTANYNPATGQCQQLDGASVCADCGNGTCEEWETPCTCDKDCEDTPLCVPAGQIVGVLDGVCCPGLAKIQIAVYDATTGMCMFNEGAMLCSDCGGGTCETGWENYCNCPADCEGGDACALAGGSCVPIPADGGACPAGAAAEPLSGCLDGEICCVPSADCLEAGETTGVFPEAPECCAGLDKIATADYDPDTGQCDPLVGGVVCAPCGNGVCDTTWETPCTCPQDCPTGTCAGEGEPADSTLGTNGCCAGLEAIEDTPYYAAADYCGSPSGALICADCGNATCEYEWENPCNCMADCDSAMLCTENGGSCISPQPDADIPACPTGTTEAWFGGCGLDQLCCFADEPACVAAGGYVPVIPNAPECCASLGLIANAFADATTGMCVTLTGASICADCGNSTCESGWENHCNCVEDCQP